MSEIPKATRRLGVGRWFDPDGAYVRRWVPELAGLPNVRLHAQWEAAPLELAAAGITVGERYPQPVVTTTRGATRAWRCTAW